MPKAAFFTFLFRFSLRGVFLSKSNFTLAQCQRVPFTFGGTVGPVTYRVCGSGGTVCLLLLPPHPLSNSVWQPEPAYCNVSRTKSPPAHTLQGPQLTQSQGQSPTGRASSMRALCLKCCSQGVLLAHLFRSSAPLQPLCTLSPHPLHSTPALFFSPALSPSNLDSFTHVVPLRQGRGFCVFCSLMPPRVMVKILNVGYHEGRVPPTPVFSR